MVFAVLFSFVVGCCMMASWILLQPGSSSALKSPPVDGWWHPLVALSSKLSVAFLVVFHCLAALLSHVAGLNLFRYRLASVMELL